MLQGLRVRPVRSSPFISRRCKWGDGRHGPNLPGSERKERAGLRELVVSAAGELFLVQRSR